jgi:hypothetical protein
MRAHLREVLLALQAVEINPLVLKGPVLAETAYPHPSLRPYGDLDILVREGDWQTTHETLLGLGYRCIQQFTGPPPKVAEHKAYYHTQYIRDDSGVMVEIHYDLWWYGLRPSLGEMFWTRAVPVTVEGVTTRMVALEERILHLGIHLHHHGYGRLIWFTDLALLLRGPEKIDWDFVVEAARREGVEIFLYYSLFYLNELLGVAAPVEVMAALRPNPVKAWIHDRLWPPADVLSTDVHDRVLCDLHEVPEAVELLLNFVLTGRRKEKLAYIGRLLAPSSEWLAYYYGTTDAATLRRRYLVHAPKMVATALSQIADTLIHGVTRHPVSPNRETTGDAATAFASLPAHSHAHAHAHGGSK